MSFVNTVRSGKARTPLQRGFELSDWTRCFDATSDGSPSDRDLVVAGAWFDLQLSAFRTALSEIVLPLTEENARRAYIASLNRDWCIMSRPSEEAGVTPRGDAMIDARITVPYLPLTERFPARASELIEGAVDGARFFLGTTPNVKVVAGADPLRVLDDLRKHAYISGMYNWFHNLWNECVWNEWALNDEPELVSIVPRNPRREVAWELSRFRQKKLWMEQIVRGLQLRGTHPKLAKAVADEVKVAQRFDGSGAGRKIVLRKARPEDFTRIPSLQPLNALDPYIDELLKDPLPADEGLSLDKLLRAWTLIESIAVLLEERMPEDSSVTTLGKLYQYCPMMRQTELQDAICRAVDVPPKTAERMLAMLTFRGFTDDVWLRPLVPAGPNLIPVIPALRTSNLMRLVEGWMRETNFDLSARGEIFENYCRREFVARLEESPLAQLGRAIPDSVTITVANQTEQIDVVCQIGRKILVCECKCCLFPVSANERYNILGTYADAAEQAKRKAAFCSSNPSAFLEATGIDASGKDFLPVVVSSSSAYVGLTVADVPISDARIIARFFDGMWESAHMDLTGNSEDIVESQTRFYERPGRADEALSGYLARPPQVYAAQPAVRAQPKDVPVLVGSKRVVLIDLEVMGDKTSGTHDDT